MINNKSVLAITLARGGSMGIPKKNIVDIHGKPLLQYTTDEIVKSKYIDDYVVSTDSDDIEQVCNELNVNVFRRKKASNTQTTAEGLLEVLQSYKKYDYVVEVMCTNPLKTIQDIDNVIEKLDNTGADSVVSVVRVWDNHPLRIKYIENDKLMNFYGDENPDVPNTRRQDLTPPAYVRNGSIYAMTYEQMVGKGLRIGKDVRPYIMDEQNSINLDEPLDLEIAKIKIRSLIDE
tara:strand:- start:481 stop:1179 length:699 start_codon:yes stop_codon:yes gene_type:complete